MSHGHRPPVDCPVCGEDLVTSRLGCPGCGTELSGNFARCDFCALDAKELELLNVFLSSRGNLREVEKHLGVSYPTARARFTDLLVKLGLAGDEAPAPESDPAVARAQILAQVSSGALTPDKAAAQLARLP